MKTLKQLIEESKLHEVMLELWYLISDENVMDIIADNYEPMYNKLKNEIKSNNPDNLQIIIKEENESDPYDEELSYEAVYHFDPSDGQEYAPDFTNWSEWLGMEIHPQTMELYNPEEIVAHCLYEMSWDGFNQEDTENARNELISRINQTSSDSNKGDSTT